ncbi:DUF3576 domain-containing protein [Actibacterium ureilyticum]|uniref:DUF3576 domain-containing protein n=1 Tax=Actibacterium ureilyticum TaxID=1590614 RepID=UPI000BAAB483|nr:DUF3576 domain-containing protein [Actibacterium ureilyticum]
MRFSSVVRGVILAVAVTSLSGCGGGLFGRSKQPTVVDPQRAEAISQQSQNTPGAVAQAEERGRSGSSFFDLFSNNDDPNTTLEVNRYLWNASLEVLNFLPVQQVDPFSGLIVTGYGTPPGGGRAYRATIHVTDPALDARSLKVALATRSGAVDVDTVRAVEDAILTRARQLRIRDAGL